MNKKAIGFKGFVIGVILLITLIFFLLQAVGNFITETNPSSPLLDESKYGLNQSTYSARNSLNSIETSVNSTRAQLASATTDPVSYLFVISKAMFEIPKTIFGFIVDGILLIPTIIFEGLGGTGAGNLLIFGLSMVTIVMIITIILLTIKFIRTGESNT